MSTQTTSPATVSASPTAPEWLTELAAACSESLSELPVRNQPSWFRQHTDELTAASAEGVIEPALAGVCRAFGALVTTLPRTADARVRVADLRTARDTMRQYVDDPSNHLPASHIVRVIGQFTECVRVESSEDTVMAPVADLALALVVVHRTALQRQRIATEVMRALVGTTPTQES